MTIYTKRLFGYVLLLFFWRLRSSFFLTRYDLSFFLTQTDVAPDFSSGGLVRLLSKILHVYVERAWVGHYHVPETWSKHISLDDNLFLAFSDLNWEMVWLFDITRRGLIIWFWWRIIGLVEGYDSRSMVPFHCCALSVRENMGLHDPIQVNLQLSFHILRSMDLFEWIANSSSSSLIIYHQMRAWSQ